MSIANDNTALQAADAGQAGSKARPFDFSQLTAPRPKARRAYTSVHKFAGPASAYKVQQLDGPPLPGIAERIAEVIGRERALYLIGQLPRYVVKDKRFPGSRASQVIMYVPTLRRLRVTHNLVRILGWHDAVKLCNAFGGEIMNPPNCAETYRRFRDASILDLAATMTRAQLLEVFDVTDRHLRNVLMEMPPDERPPRA